MEKRIYVIIALSNAIIAKIMKRNAIIAIEYVVWNIAMRKGNVQNA
jgi:hypothetical protein